MIYLHSTPYDLTHDTQTCGISPELVLLSNETCPPHDEISASSAHFCHTFQADRLRLALLVFCPSDLAIKFHRDMTAKDAGSFAEEVRVVADKLEAWRRRSRGNVTIEHGGLTGPITWENSLVARVIAEMQRGAQWYKSVSALGFGVRIESLLES